MDDEWVTPPPESARGHHLLDALRARADDTAPRTALEPADPADPGWSVGRLLWTLATAIPLVSSVAWLFAAVRNRRPAYLLETVSYAIWPFVSFIILAAVTAVVAHVDTLLFHQSDYESQVYREHAALLMRDHPQYTRIESGIELGAVGDWELMMEELRRLNSRYDPLARVAVVWILLIWLGTWIASLVHAQREWGYVKSGALPPAATIPNPQKLVISHVVLWFMFGWMGAHRFYLGRWISGLCYLFSLGGMGVGWAADLFPLRSAVHRANADDDTELIMAPWSTGARFGVFDFLFRWAFFLVAPGFFVWLCVGFDQFELLVVLMFTLMICGLLGNLQHWLSRLEVLEKLPLLRPAVSIVNELYAFYYDHKPRSFWFYVFAVFTAPWALWSSGDFRREASLYLRFLITVLSAVVINQMRVIPATYQYHSWMSIAGWVVTHLLLASFVSSVILTPIITTTFTFNLSGRHRRLRFLSISAICISCAVGLLTVGDIYVRETPTWSCYALINSRLRDATFQQRLERKSRLFLAHYIERAPLPLDSWYEMANHPTLTRRYREDVLAALTPTSEAKVFHVITMNVDGDDPDRAWLAVGIALGEDDYESWRTLFVMTPDKEFHAEWGDPPPLVADQFQLAKELWNSQVEHRIARRDPLTDERVHHQTRELVAKSRAPASLALASTAITEARAVFDPGTTRALRQQLDSSLGRETGGLRVFWLPPVRELPWRGVLDGDQPMAVISPRGDFFPNWDRDVFVYYRNVRRQLARLENVVPELERAMARLHQDDRPEQSALQIDEALRLDLEREHGERFLRGYVALDFGEQVGENFSRYIRRVASPMRIRSLDVIATPGDERPHWLCVADRRGPLYAYSAQHGMYVRNRSGMVNLFDAPAPASIVGRLVRTHAELARQRAQGAKLR